MSYMVFFSMSSGLARPMWVPGGTLKVCQKHVARVESSLGFVAEKYRDNPAHWKSTTPKDGVTDETFCNVAQEHNNFVRSLYFRLGEWQKAGKDKLPRGAWISGYKDRPIWSETAASVPPEELTPADCGTFWHGLVEIDVPAHRWTREYYRNRMEHAYEVLRGREHEGVSLGAKALSPKQAAAVVNIFSTYLDNDDCRLDVPNGHDYLASSIDGGYEWCEKCGPVHPDDIGGCRKKACPLLAERDAEDPEDGRRWVVKDKATGRYKGKQIGEWSAKLDKRVRRHDDRDEAEAIVKMYKQHMPKVVVVPVRRIW